MKPTPAAFLTLEEPRDVAAARRAVCDLIADAHLDLVDDIRLAVSELATNALLHGDPPIVVGADLRDDTLRVEVADGSDTSVAPQPISSTASSGRGLSIVHSIAHRWGVEARDVGKVVWLEFRLNDAPDMADAEVQLLSVPVETYLRSQEHLESTLHELQLLGLTADAEFADLEAKLVMPLRRAMETFTSARRHGRAAAETAASSGQDLIDLTWRLPRDAATSALVYAEAVCELRRLANDGVVLTPPADDDVARLHQWIADQVISQMTDRTEPTPFE